MKRNVEKTRRLLHHLARRAVRGSAVAALIAGGYFGASAELEAEANDDSGDAEAERPRLRRALDRATEAVLATPHSPASERALVALMAASEALAIAGVEEPSEREINEVLVYAAVASEV